MCTKSNPPKVLSLLRAQKLQLSFLDNRWRTRRLSLDKSLCPKVQHQKLNGFLAKSKTPSEN